MHIVLVGREFRRSPSVWREWIEIVTQLGMSETYASLPPCGGSGLKCVATVASVVGIGLPPCGGSGLKSNDGVQHYELLQSPSVWREWIEMRAAL